jgi:hypothetical protein
MATPIICAQSKDIYVSFQSHPSGSGQQYVVNGIATQASNKRLGLYKHKYKFTNIPQHHAIGIFTSDTNEQTKLNFTGGTIIQKNNRNYYYGTFDLEVIDDFGTADLECVNHGGMKKPNFFEYSNTCNLSSYYSQSSTATTTATTATITTKTISETTSGDNRNLSLTLQLDKSLAAGDKITIDGLTGTNNTSGDLAITGSSGKFGDKGAWTKSNGTLVLTVASGQTINENTQFQISVTLILTNYQSSVIPTVEIGGGIKSSKDNMSNAVLSNINNSTTLTTKTISETTSGDNRNLSLTLQLDKSLAAGDKITIDGLTGTDTNDNTNLTITGSSAGNFDNEGAWTQSSGTLVLTVGSGQTINVNIPINLIITLSEPITVQSGGVTPRIKMTLNGSDNISYTDLDKPVGGDILKQTLDRLMTLSNSRQNQQMTSIQSNYENKPKFKNKAANMKNINNLMSIASGGSPGNQNKKLGSSDNPIDLEKLYFNKDYFLISNEMFKQSTDNTLVFKGGNGNTPNKTGSTSNFQIIFVPDINNPPNSKYKITNHSTGAAINKEYANGNMLVLNDMIKLEFDITNGIVDGRNDSQIKEMEEYQSMTDSNHKTAYENSLKQINKKELVITAGTLNELDASMNAYLGLIDNNKKQEKLQDIINNMLLNENNKTKDEIEFNMGDDFDLGLGDDSAFKDHFKKTKIFKAKDNHNTKVQPNDFFGSILDYSGASLPDSFRMGYALLKNKDEKINIQMGDNATNDQVKFTKTDDGFEAILGTETKTFKEGGRFQQNGYTVEFKNGCIINSVSKSEKDLLANFNTLDRTHVSQIMNCIGSDNKVDLTNSNDLETKIAAFTDAAELNKFRNDMIDVIFDTPDNKDIEEFVADNTTFLKLTAGKLPDEFANKKESIIFKNTAKQIDPTEMISKITDEKGVYIKTRKGQTEKIEFKFGSDVLEMEHTNGDKFDFKQKGTRKTDKNALADGFEIKKYDSGNKTFVKETVDTNKFNKDDVLELTKNEITYTLQLGSSYIVKVVDGTAKNVVIGNGFLFRKNYSVLNKHYKKQYSMKGLFNVVNNMKNNPKDNRIQKFPLKDRSGDRLRKVKSLAIFKSKVSKSDNNNN